MTPDKMASIDKPLPNDGPSVTLTIRLLMQGKEVGSIIGKKGEIVKRFREESGARINISDGSCPERIVTITGNTDGIIKAFTLICSKFEEDLQNTPTIGSGSVPKPPITLRLIVPASQCGSIIGKGGSKIKEIREITGASIQVASEMLPNSTERAVTISGANEAITQCIYHICCIMLESPPKGATIPYRPKPQLGSSGALLAGGQALGLQGNMSLPSHPDVSTPLPGPVPFGHPFHPLPPGAGLGTHGTPIIPPLAVPAPIYPPTPVQGASLFNSAMDFKCGQQFTNATPIHDLPKLGAGLGGLAALGIGGVTGGGSVNPAVTSLTALAALAGSQIRPSGANNSGNNSQTHEMTVPNELIGCIIGKGGTKIAEIRQMSGAMIRISNCEDREGGKTDRTITITGTGEAVALAQYLINTSIELHKATMEAQGGVSNGGGERSGNASGSTGSSNTNSALSAIPLLKLLATQPNLLTGALGGIGGIGGLSGLGDILSGGGGSHIQTTGVHRNTPHKSFSPRLRSVANSPSSNSNSVRVKTERNKFAPY